MVDVHEVREVDEIRGVPMAVPVKRGSGITAFVMFLAGGVLIAIAALVVMDAHWAVTWPAGHVDIGVQPPVATALNSSAPGSAVTTPAQPSVSAPTEEIVTQNPEDADTTSPTAPTGDASTTNDAPPAATTTEPAPTEGAQ